MGLYISTMGGKQGSLRPSLKYVLSYGYVPSSCCLSADFRDRRLLEGKDEVVGVSEGKRGQGVPPLTNDQGQ